MEQIINGHLINCPINQAARAVSSTRLVNRLFIIYEDGFSSELDFQQTIDALSVLPGQAISGNDLKELSRVQTALELHPIQGIGSQAAE